MTRQDDSADVARFADMLSAMGTEPRLRILRLQIANSTLSHHLDKLKGEDLVSVRREGTFLRYSAHTQALQELLGFLYAECCTRNKAIRPQAIVCCK